MKFNKTESKINVNEHTRIRARTRTIFTYGRIYRVCVCEIRCEREREETKLAKVVSEFENNRIYNGTTAPPNVSPNRNGKRKFMCCTRAA